MDAQNDVVLYTGVWQDTTKITAMLKAARRLLRKGGTFIAGTFTHSLPRTALVLGLAAERKPLSCQDWDILLNSDGFTGVDAWVNDSCAYSRDIDDDLNLVAHQIF